MKLQFEHTEFLYLLGAIVIFILLFLLVLRWKKKVVKRIGDKKLVKELIKNYSPGLFTLKFILFILAFAAGIIAVANLRTPGGADNITRKGIDVVIALDVSKSMLATDLQPSRLERAQQMVLRLMEQMPNDRIALVVFAGKAYMQMPLTIDHNAAAVFVSTASPETVPIQGTVFSEAMNMSARAFNSKEGRFKSVVLISDGEDHDQDALKTAEAIAEQGIMVCTVGIGSAEGSQIPDPSTNDFKRDAMGNVVISKLNEDVLRQIAEKTNGIYVHFQTTEQTIKAIKGQLSQIESKTFTDISLLNYKTYYMWFTGAMFLLLILEFLLPERKRVLA